jgi:hypothetical protein
MGKKTVDHNEAIRLRFDGLSNDVIAKRLGTSGVYISQLFMIGGILETAYKEYEKRQLDLLQDIAISGLKKSVKKAGETMTKALDQYLVIYKELEGQLAITSVPQERYTIMARMAGVLQQASNQAERVLDRAGMPIVSKSEIRNGDLPTYDDLIKRLNSEGIDPKTGHRGRTGEVLASMGLSN